MSEKATILWKKFSRGGDYVATDITMNKVIEGHEPTAGDFVEIPRGNSIGNAAFQISWMNDQVRNEAWSFLPEGLELRRYRGAERWRIVAV